MTSPAGMDDRTPVSAEQAREALDQAIPEHLRSTRHGESFLGDRYATLRQFLEQAAAPAPAPLGWLYDWTHSSALGKPDEHFTNFTEDEAYARNGVGHHNVRPVYGNPNGVPGGEVKHGE